MTSFSQELRQWPVDRVRHFIRSMNRPELVARALTGGNLTTGDFAALLSPAAATHLETMARRAALLTRRRFGRIMQMYAPLYVSNHCVNSCLYCGFNCRNRVERTKLTVAEAEAEAAVLARQGFRHLLLVSGEDRRAVPVDYFVRLVRKLQAKFASVAIELYPLEEAEYRALVEAGVDSLTLYQETYQEEEYEKFHPAGPKRDFSQRLGSAERAARAGITFLGVGALLGLADWRIDSFYTGLHARWLTRHYWRQQASVSFPRLRQATGGFAPPQPVSDAELVQIICAQRLFLPDAGLVLSTREPSGLRDRLVALGITRISAGSKTTPGGYSRDHGGEPQFAVQDQRSPAEVRQALRRQGFDPVDKDWDAAYH